MLPGSSKVSGVLVSSVTFTLRVDYIGKSKYLFEMCNGVVIVQEKAFPFFVISQRNRKAYMLCRILGKV